LISHDRNNTEDALGKALSAPLPDVILLDFHALLQRRDGIRRGTLRRLPMDGGLRRLRALPGGAAMPVLIMTALNHAAVKRMLSIRE
jgi:CheY-like chemotaxis protein